MNAPGSFSSCMMESDSESAASAKWLRGKSVAVSLAIEAAAVGALLVAPLLSTGVLPPLLVSTPTPAYRGEAQPVRRTTPNLSSPRRTFLFNAARARPVFTHESENADAAPPAVGIPIGNQAGPAGTQPGIPGRENNSAAMHIAPPASAPRNKPLPQSEGVMAARLVRRIDPVYPPMAQMMRLSGIVLLRAIIGTDGAVQRVEVLSGNPILAQAAVAAVRQWRYQPTRLDGQPVEVETSVTVTFVLN